MSEMRRLRILAGKKQQEVAEAVGVPRAVISMHENRGLRLDADVELRIRNFLLAAIQDRQKRCSKVLHEKSAEAV